MGTPATPCPCCGGPQIGREALCSLCWNQVPQRLRTAVARAQKAIGYNPASNARQIELQTAIADACASVGSIG